MIVNTSGVLPGLARPDVAYAGLVNTVLGGKLGNHPFSEKLTVNGLPMAVKW